MVTQVVCKMQCNEVPVGDSREGTSVQAIGLGAVWEPDEGKRQQPENAVFGKFTPWGSFRAGRCNRQALGNRGNTHGLLRCCFRGSDHCRE